MIRLTTPTHAFRLPISSEDIDQVQITYVQKGRVVLSKSKNDCTLEGNIVKVSLSQSETMLFAQGALLIQINVLTLDGRRMASKQFPVFCDNNLFDEVMG